MERSSTLRSQSPGTKGTPNVDGYSATGRMAYVFNGPTGRIVQWIQDGTNVSACEMSDSTGTYVSGTFGKLECSRPSPYVPSNGFLEESLGLVPTYVDDSTDVNSAFAGVGVDEVVSVRPPSMPAADFGNDHSNHLHQPRRVHRLLVLAERYGQLFASDSQLTQAQSDGSRIHDLGHALQSVDLPPVRVTRGGHEDEVARNWTRRHGPRK